MSERSFTEWVFDDDVVAWLAICLVQVRLKILGFLQSL